MGVDTIKYSTFNTDAFRVSKVYNQGKCGVRGVVSAACLGSDVEPEVGGVAGVGVLLAAQPALHPPAPARHQPEITAHSLV